MARLAGVPESHAPTVFRAIDKLDKIGPDGVKRDLVATGVDDVSAARVVELVTRTGSADELLDAAAVDLDGVAGGAEAVEELRQLAGFLDELDVRPNSWKIDLSLARGIDYYTGPVFEARVDEPKIGSVAGAGRYDGLVGTFLGREVPATGMSLGLERILEVIQEFDLIPRTPSVADIIVAAFPETLRENARVANELRSSGINADLSMLTNRSLGDQMKYAARRGIPFAVIVGPDEITRKVALIRNLATTDQREVEIASLAQEAKLTISG
jgi:histidyl-tRNA synthetase